MLLRVYTVLARLSGARVLIPLLLAAVDVSLALLAAWGIMGLVKAAYSVPLGQQKGGVIVVTSYAVAPYTSMVSLVSVEDTLKDLASVTPIVLAPVAISGKPVLVVGLPKVNETTCTIFVRGDVAQELGLRNDSLIFIDSIFIGSSVPVKVVILPGFVGPAVTSIECARMLRGFPRDKASILIIKPKPGTRSMQPILRRLGIMKKKIITDILYVTARWSRHGTVFSEVKSPEQAFLERLGLQRIVIIAVAVSVSVMLGVLAYLIPMLSASLMKREIELLYSIGVPHRAVKEVMFIGTAVMVVLSAFLFHLVQLRTQFIRVHVLGYSMPIKPELSITLATAAAIVAITAYSYMRVDL